MSEMTNHSNFSAADIEKYWKGQLLPSQMHALEKAAHDDPFLADALEGYKERALALPADIKELDQRLQARVEEKKVKTLFIGYWWKIAAAIIVLAGATWLYRSVTVSYEPAKQAGTDLVKQAPAHVNKTDFRPTTPPATAASDSNMVAALEEKKKPLPANSLQQVTTDNLSAPSSEYKTKDTAFLAPATKPASVADRLDGRVPGLAITQQKEIQKDTLKYRQQVAAAAVRPRLNDGFAAAKDKNSDKDELKKVETITIRGAASRLNTFKGQVLDSLNKPVEGASVMIPGHQDDIITDNRGYFTIKAPDTALKVSVASVGYNRRDAMLRNNVGSVGPSSNQIVLQQSNASLDEVVVVGYGTARKKEVTGSVSVSVLNTEPVVGWDKYNDYITANKKIPENLSAIHGYVVVSFYVTRKGKIRDIKIEKSLNKPLDEEAIRLIKNGPSWHLLKGKGAKASVMVQF